MPVCLPVADYERIKTVAETGLGSHGQATFDTARGANAIVACKLKFGDT